MHAVLSVVSAGTWLPVWFILALKRAPWRCSNCGKEVAARRVRGQRPAWIVRHFREFRELRPWPFFWRVNVEILVVGALAATAMVAAVGEPGDRLEGMTVAELFVAAVLVAPAIETLVGQTLPVHLVRRCGGGLVLQVAVSTVVFAAPHFLADVVTGVAAGLVGGLYLGFTYAHWAGRSTWTALWMTAASHAADNFVLLALEALVAGPG